MKQDMNNWPVVWKCSVLAVMVTIGILTPFVPGSGIHARLDAREGVESASFQESRQFYYEQLTTPQLSNLNWAIRRLPAHEMQTRYGDHPRIRDVVLGEIMRAADTQLEAAKPLAADVAKIDPVRVSAAIQKYKSDVEQRKKRLNGNKAYWPVITSVKREPTPRGYMLVSYKLNPPQNMNFEFLPCALEYGDRFEPKRGKLEFDCLFMPMKNGEFLARLPEPTGLEVSDVTLGISADYSRALVRDERGGYSEIDGVQAEIPEVLALQDIYLKLKSILDNKAYF